MSLIGDRVGDNQVGLGVHRRLDDVADMPAVPSACRHGAGIRIGQRDLSVRRLIKRPVHGLQALDLLSDAAVAPPDVSDPLDAGLALFLTVDPDHFVVVAFHSGFQMAILPRVKLRSRLLTPLNLLPSIATQAPCSTPMRRQSSTNRAQTRQIAGPLSRRKSAMDL